MHDIATIGSRSSGTLYYGKNASACPFNPGNRAITPRHSPLANSKATTSSRATQNKCPLGAKRNPRGFRNSAFPPGEKTRTRCPSMASYSRTLVTASTAPNGCSLEATILPLGAMARSSGLNSGSVTNREGYIGVPGLNARMTLSPRRSGPIPEARNSRPS